MLDHFVSLEETIFLIKICRVYSIETAIDNSKFKNYSLLDQQLDGFIERLYENQRKINKDIFEENHETSEITSKFIEYNTKTICNL